MAHVQETAAAAAAAVAAAQQQMAVAAAVPAASLADGLVIVGFVALSWHCLVLMLLPTLLAQVLLLQLMVMVQLLLLLKAAPQDECHCSVQATLDTPPG